MLKNNCGCGNCTFKDLITNGCPKPLRPQFLYLDHDTLTQNEKDILLLKLQEDADAIDRKYSTMVVEFEYWMEINVVVTIYRKILSKVPGSMLNNVPLLKDRWTEIKIADHADCSVLLSDYHTWFNCSALKQALELAKH